MFPTSERPNETTWARRYSASFCGEGCTKPTAIRVPNDRCRTFAHLSIASRIGGNWRARALSSAVGCASSAVAAAGTTWLWEGRREGEAFRCPSSRLGSRRKKREGGDCSPAGGCGGGGGSGGDGPALPPLSWWALVAPPPGDSDAMELVNASARQRSRARRGFFYFPFEAHFRCAFVLLARNY